MKFFVFSLTSLALGFGVFTPAWAVLPGSLTETEVLEQLPDAIRAVADQVRREIGPDARIPRATLIYACQEILRQRNENRPVAEGTVDVALDRLEREPGNETVTLFLNGLLTETAAPIEVAEIRSVRFRLIGDAAKTLDQWVKARISEFGSFEDLFDVLRGERGAESITPDQLKYALDRARDDIRAANSQDRRLTRFDACAGGYALYMEVYEASTPRPSLHQRSSQVFLYLWNVKFGAMAVYGKGDLETLANDAHRILSIEKYQVEFATLVGILEELRRSHSPTIPTDLVRWIPGERLMPTANEPVTLEYLRQIGATVASPPPTLEEDVVRLFNNAWNAAFKKAGGDVWMVDLQVVLEQTLTAIQDNRERPRKDVVFSQVEQLIFSAKAQGLVSGLSETFLEVDRSKPWTASWREWMVNGRKVLAWLISKLDQANQTRGYRKVFGTLYTELRQSGGVKANGDNIRPADLYLALQLWAGTTAAKDLKGKETLAYSRLEGILRTYDPKETYTEAPTGVGKKRGDSSTEIIEPKPGAVLVTTERTRVLQGFLLRVYGLTGSLNPTRALEFQAFGELSLDIQKRFGSPPSESEMWASLVELIYELRNKNSGALLNKKIAEKGKVRSAWQQMAIHDFLTGRTADQQPVQLTQIGKRLAPFWEPTDGERTPRKVALIVAQAMAAVFDDPGVSRPDVIVYRDRGVSQACSMRGCASEGLEFKDPQRAPGRVKQAIVTDLKRLGVNVETLAAPEESPHFKDHPERWAVIVVHSDGKYSVLIRKGAPVVALLEEYVHWNQLQAFRDYAQIAGEGAEVTEFVRVVLRLSENPEAPTWATDIRDKWERRARGILERFSTSPIDTNEALARIRKARESDAFMDWSLLKTFVAREGHLRYLETKQELATGEQDPSIANEPIGKKRRPLLHGSEKEASRGHDRAQNDRSGTEGRRLVDPAKGKGSRDVELKKKGGRR